MQTCLFPPGDHVTFIISERKSANIVDLRKSANVGDADESFEIIDIKRDSDGSESSEKDDKDGASENQVKA